MPAFLAIFRHESMDAAPDRRRVLASLARRATPEALDGLLFEVFRSSARDPKTIRRLLEVGAIPASLTNPVGFIGVVSGEIAGRPEAFLGWRDMMVEEARTERALMLACLLSECHAAGPDALAPIVAMAGDADQVDSGALIHASRGHGPLKERLGDWPMTVSEGAIRIACDAALSQLATLSTRPDDADLNGPALQLLAVVADATSRAHEPDSTLALRQAIVDGLVAAAGSMLPGRRGRLIQLLHGEPGKAARAAMSDEEGERWDGAFGAGVAAPSAVAGLQVLPAEPFARIADFLPLSDLAALLVTSLGMEGKVLNYGRLSGTVAAHLSMADYKQAVSSMIENQDAGVDPIGLARHAESITPEQRTALVEWTFEQVGHDVQSATSLMAEFGEMALHLGDEAAGFVDHVIQRVDRLDGEDACIDRVRLIAGLLLPGHAMPADALLPVARLVADPTKFDLRSCIDDLAPLAPGGLQADAGCPVDWAMGALLFTLREGKPQLALLFGSSATKVASTVTAAVSVIRQFAPAADPSPEAAELRSAALDLLQSVSGLPAADTEAFRRSLAPGAQHDVRDLLTSDERARWNESFGWP